MKKHWLRSLRNSVVGFLCATFLAVPWAAAQQQALPPLPAIDDGLLTVLGIEKAQLETSGLDADQKSKIEGVRTNIQEAVRAFSMRDAQTTLSKLESAQKDDPSLPPPSVMMARLCFAATNDQNVVNLGRGFLERAVNLHKTQPEAYLLLGRLALGEGRLSDAELNLEKAQQYTPAAQGEPANPATTATGWSKERRTKFLKDVYAGMVSVSEQRQQWDTADHQIDAWIELDAKDPMAQFRKGGVLFMKVASEKSGTKNYDAAREAFDKAYKLAQEDPNRDKKEVTAVPPPELAMLQLFSRSGATSEATKEVESLAKLVENYQEKKEQARVYSAMSQWYLQQNNPAMAGELAAKASSLDAESPALKQLAAVMHYYANDPKAVMEFTEMNQAAPDDFVASNFLALLLCESSDKDTQNKAVRLAELNRRLNPKSPDAISTLGWVYYKAGRPAEALQQFNILPQAVNEAQSQITADTAYYMAKVIFDSQQVAPAERIGAVIRLLEQAVGSNGPFKHKTEAREWYELLSNKKLPPPGTTNLVPSTTTTGTPPLPVTPPATNPAPKAPNSDN